MTSHWYHIEYLVFPAAAHFLLPKVWEKTMIKEIPGKATSGYSMIPILLVAQLAAAYLTITALMGQKFVLAALFLVVTVIVFAFWFGFFMVQPKTGRVLQLFGTYIGTVSDPGLRWANPLLSKKTVSRRIRNFESSQLKVNDNSGSPIEIAAVVVWEVVDTAEAIFEGDDYEEANELFEEVKDEERYSKDMS